MLLTVRETAERLRVSARTVEREIAAGRLACVRVRSRPERVPKSCTHLPGIGHR